jgi:xylulokinase
VTSAGPLLLGIDVGSSRIKALLLDAAGGEVRSAVTATPFVTTGDRTEASVDALLDAVAGLLPGLGSDCLRRTEAVGVAGMAESGAPLGRDGEPLAPVIAWHDRRGEDVAGRLEDRFGDDLSGRIGQRVRYVSSVAKLGWLIDDGLHGVTTWLGVPELVLRALTGVEATEHSLAARTSCLDIATKEWLPDVAGAAGFDVGVFPGILTAGAAMGHVTPRGANWSGLPEGIPVTLAGHDHLAGFVGSGARPADLANSVGTAETVVARASTLPDRQRAAEGGVAVTLFPGGEGWGVLAGAARAGLAIDSVAAALQSTPADLDAAVASTGADPLDAPGLLDSLRRREPPGPHVPAGSAGEVWATLLDALATATGEAIAAVTGVAGPRQRLVVFGGGSTSRPWLEAKARHTALPVHRSTTAHAVARGAAVQAGAAAGWWATPADVPVAAVEPVTGRVRRRGTRGSEVPHVVAGSASAEHPQRAGKPRTGGSA